MSLWKDQRNYRWYLLATLGVIFFVLGLVGFLRYAAWHNLPNTFWDNLYLTLQLIPLGSGAVQPPIPLELELARFLLPLLTGAATVTVVLDLFREQIRMLRLHGLRDQIIICGLSRKGLLLANEFRRQGADVVVIEQDEGNDWIESCRVQGMFVLLGDAADPVLLRQAGVQRARGLFAVCDDDGINVEIAIQMRALTQGREGEPLPCLVHVSDPQLWALLRERETELEQAPFRIEMFNVFERGARRLLQVHPAWSDEQAAAGGAPHILLVGLGRMGESLLLHAVRNWRNRRPDTNGHLKITVVDRRAEQKTESLYVRYPQLAAACELIPLQMDVHSPEFERARFLFDAQGSPCIDVVYICVDHDSLGLQAGLTLLRRLPGHTLPVIIRMAEEGGLAKLLVDREDRLGAYQNLFAFAYLERTCTPDLLKNTPRDILAHARYDEYLQEQSGAEATAPGKAAVYHWEQVDEQLRSPYYRWIDRIQAVLKASGYRILALADLDTPLLEFSTDEVEQMAHLEHDLWCQEKQNDGWRHAPGALDAAAKTDPDLVSWDLLADTAKERERMLVDQIPAFLGRAGFQVGRRAADE